MLPAPDPKDKIPDAATPDLTLPLHHPLLPYAGLPPQNPLDRPHSPPARQAHVARLDVPRPQALKPVRSRNSDRLENPRRSMHDSGDLQ